MICPSIDFGFHHRPKQPALFPRAQPFIGDLGVCRASGDSELYLSERNVALA
jgi:hypothetical protein